METTESNQRQTRTNSFDKLGVPDWNEFQAQYADILPPARIGVIYEQVVSLAVWDYLKGQANNVRK